MRTVVDHCPSNFAFQLTAAEKAEVSSDCNYLARLKMDRKKPEGASQTQLGQNAIGQRTARAAADLDLSDQKYDNTIVCLRKGTLNCVASSTRVTRETLHTLSGSLKLM